MRNGLDEVQGDHRPKRLDDQMSLATWPPEPEGAQWPVQSAVLEALRPPGWWNRQLQGSLFLCALKQKIAMKRIKGAQCVISSSSFEHLIVGRNKRIRVMLHKPRHKCAPSMKVSLGVLKTASSMKQRGPLAIEKAELALCNMLLSAS